MKPGEEEPIRVVFGYENGFRPSERQFDRTCVSQLLFFTGKSGEERNFVISGLQAAGAAGDGPPVDPARRVVRPRDGVLLGECAAESPSVAFMEGATAAEGGTGRIGKGKPVEVAVKAGRRGAVKIGPLSGYWDLGLATEVVALVRNTGKTPLVLQMRLDSSGDSSNVVRVPAIGALAPGESIEAKIPFAASLPWRGDIDANTGKGVAAKGTGTKFASNRTRVLVAIAESDAEERKFEIEYAKALESIAELPEWLGSRPPVAGEWKLVFDEEFDGNAIDENRWNVRSSNFWDKRTHFSRDNAIVADGKLHLRYENRSGFQNDDPGDHSAVSYTPWVCGIVNGYGKTVHCYGYYFEARMKLPTASGLWPAFWMMPDRGEGTPGESWRRNDTHDGGMEFDILEHLTGWGTISLQYRLPLGRIRKRAQGHRDIGHLFRY